MSLERERMKLARKEMAKPEIPFKLIDLDNVGFVPAGMTRAYRNNRYTIMIYDGHQTTRGLATRVMVQRLDNTPIPFHWREMQRIKNEVFGKETVAVEYYPAESELIDTHNIYWMWIYPDGVIPIPIL